MSVEEPYAERAQRRRGFSVPQDLWRGVLGSALPGFYYAFLALAIPAVAIFAVASVLLLTFKFVNPPMSSLMVWRVLQGEEVTQQWVPLNRISPNLIRAVVASEDARFCQHFGIDLQELEHAIARARRRNDVTAVRGASTISMQVTKNLFLWPARSLFRKGIELAITPLMEVFWSKRRILEVYLNIAEWGPGIFGAEAAARYHFGKRARDLSVYQASLLAAALPNPIARKASAPGRTTKRYAASIRRRMPAARAYARCVLRR